RCGRRRSRTSSGCSWPAATTAAESCSGLLRWGWMPWCSWRTGGGSTPVPRHRPGRWPRTWRCGRRWVPQGPTVWRMRGRPPARATAAGAAWFSLAHAPGVQPGASVLVLGATGVTGALAVQLAKHQFGAGQVTAVGRDEARLHSLADQGADRVIRIGDLSDLGGTVRALHTERPIDVVLDYIWGPPAEQVLGALGNEELAAGFHRTRYVQIGEGAGATIELPAAVLRSAGVELVGQGAGSVPKEAFARVLPEILPALFELLDRGVLGVQTVERPLAGVADAWLEPTSSGVRTVLVP